MTSPIHSGTLETISNEGDQSASHSDGETAVENS